MSNELDALSVITNIERQSQEHDNSTRVVEYHQPGLVERQGDIYLLHVKEDFPRKEVNPDPAARKLAPGTNVGSNHVIGGDITLYGPDKAAIVKLVESGAFGVEFESMIDIETLVNETIGPFVVVGQDGAEVDHPRHAPLRLPPGCYQTGYQLDAKTLQRVQD